MGKVSPAAVAVVFLAGFILMVLEVVGARYLAKDFGSAFHVWVSQIGVVLIALAAGYALGGALADRSGRLGPVGWLLGLAGLWTLGIPWFAARAIGAIVTRHPADVAIPPLWQKLDPVLGSGLVFLLPCLVLAMLSPCMIRLATSSLAQVGRSSGALIAAGTLGSIAGVFVAGYVLIEHMRMTRIFQAMGALTLALAAVCLGLDRRWRPALVGLLAWISCPIGFGAVVYETTSTYHHIRVVDEGGYRSLRFDGAEQSRMFQTDPVRGHFEYSEFFHLPWLWNGTLTNVLMVGLGGASTQRSYAHYYPQVTVETAELDPAVQRVAREYFGLREGARQIVHLEDGRTFLRRGRETYGAILMDAYTANRYGAYVPYHLVTREFFKLAADRLTTNGVLCYNMIGTVAGAQSDLMGSVYRTLAAVFPQVYIFPARESANVVLIATRSPERWTPVALHARGRQLAQAGQVRLPAFAARIAALQPQAPAAYAQALVLEDDFAPTDGMLRVFSAAGLQPAPTTAP